MSNALSQRRQERKLRAATLLRKAKHQNTLFAMAIPCILLVAIF